MKKIFKFIPIKIAFWIFAAAGLSAVASALLAQVSIKATDYSVDLKALDAPIKIAVCSDLHNRRFGKGNSRIINKIKAQQPDAVFMPGDFVTEKSDETDVEEFLALAEAAVKIAPTYYSLGNHEWLYINQHGDAFLDRLSALGVTVLENEFVDTEINGAAVRIGGISDLAFPYRVSREEWKVGETSVFLQAFEDTDLPKLMLCHRPESFSWDGVDTKWKIDLIFSGHTHGGIVRLPFVGGLIAPNQWFFPALDYGEFELSNAKMIICSGFAGYGAIPRVFNLPEIAVVSIS